MIGRGERIGTSEPCRPEAVGHLEWLFLND
jgi:hypothetical protein